MTADQRDVTLADNRIAGGDQPHYPLAYYQRQLRPARSGKARTINIKRYLDVDRGGQIHSNTTPRAADPPPALSVSATGVR